MKNTFFKPLALVLLVILTAATLKAQLPYHTGDFNRVQTFLNLPSTNPGVTNGEQLNAAYSPTAPFT